MALDRLGWRFLPANYHVSFQDGKFVLDIGQSHHSHWGGSFQLLALDNLHILLVLVFVWKKNPINLNCKTCKTSCTQNLIT